MKREENAPKTRKYDAIIFDMDGTLLDTLEDLAASVNLALTKHGYPQRSLQDIRQFVGNGVYMLVFRALPEGTPSSAVERCLADFREHYAQHSKVKTKAYAGISDLLRTLQSRGFKLGVISNKYDQVVKELAQDFFGGFFDIAVGEREGIEKKPAPDSIYEELKVLHTTRERAVYVGDSEVDMETAHNAGVVSVGVTWGFRDRALLVEKKADYIIDAPMELLHIVEE